MSHVSASTIAKALNLSERRVRQLREEGVFAREAHGQYDLAKCLLAHHHYLQKKLRSNGTEDEAKIPGLTAERERRLRVQRERDEIRLAQERGALIPIETYRVQFAKDIAMIRERFLNLKSIAPELEGEPRAVIEDKIDKAVRNVLTSLANGDPLPISGSREPGDLSAGAETGAPVGGAADQPKGERVGGPEPLPSQGQ